MTPELTVPGLPEVCVVGDLALVKGQDGAPVPALAAAARQMAGSWIAAYFTYHRGARLLTR